MVLVDTSIWIDYLQKNNTFGEKVTRLIDQGEVAVAGLVVAELIQGAKTNKEVKLIRSFIEAFEFLKEGSETWEKAGILSFELRKKGKIIGLADCYLATLALENNLAIFTLDKHFKEIAGFTNIKLYPL